MLPEFLASGYAGKFPPPPSKKTKDLGHKLLPTKGESQSNSNN